MANNDVTMTFTPEAIGTMSAVDRLLIDTLRTVEAGDWFADFDIDPGTLGSLKEYKKLLARVDEMRTSWHRGVLGLIQLAAGFGNLRVMADGEYCLYFHQPESGFSGGVVLHWDYRDNKRLPTGTWSTHS